MGTEFHRDAGEWTALGSNRSGHGRRRHRAFAGESTCDRPDPLELLWKTIRLHVRPDGNSFFRWHIECGLHSPGIGLGRRNSRRFHLVAELVRVLRQGQLDHDSPAAGAIWKYEPQYVPR